MADPTKYTKGYSFEGYQANNPSKPLPAPRLDDELENIATSIDETIDALKDIRRSDGKLKNGIVDKDATDPAFLAGLAGDAAALVSGAGGVKYSETFAGEPVPALLVVRPIAEGSGVYTMALTLLEG